MHYVFTGEGFCFDVVRNNQLGDEADVFLSIDGGQERQLRWRPVGCWTYDDGTVPYAVPKIGRPPVRFKFILRKGAAVRQAAVDFPPPSYVPQSQL